METGTGVYPELVHPELVEGMRHRSRHICVQARKRAFRSGKRCSQKPLWGYRLRVIKAARGRTSKRAFYGEPVEPFNILTFNITQSYGFRSYAQPEP